MKTLQLSNVVNAGSPGRLGAHLRAVKQLCAFCLILFSITASQAATLTWDAGNTNNGASIDPASGFWDLTHSTTYLTNTTTTTATTNANLAAGGLDWFQVNVPASGWAATNILLYATNLPVNVWFSTSQTTNNFGDTLLMSGVTSGTSVLTTASVPNIVQGGTYYLGIDNAANGVAVGYALEVDLSVTNPVTTASTLLNWNTGSGNTNWTQASTTSPGTVGNNAVFGGPDAPDGTYQVVLDGGQIAASNVTINASGYTFSGSPLFLADNVSLLAVADGKNVVFSNNVTGANNLHEWRLGLNGAPATATFYGALGTPQPLYTSTNGSIFYFSLSGTSGSGTTHVNADVRITNGTYAATGAYVIGRQRPGTTQPLNATGTLTLDGPATILNQTADYISLGRDSVWNSTLIIQNGATLNDQIGTPSGNPGIGLPRPGSTGNNNQSWMKVYGGTVNMGSGSGTAQPISLQDGGGRPGQISVLTQTGGVINAWGGIQLGGAGTFTGGSAMVTNSGGFLYIGSRGGAGIRYGTGIPATNNVSLTGGTVGALQTWISSVPMTLATLNGKITFQCADASTTPFNISLSGALTGSGGLNKSGGGTLTLSGANNYSGSTVVSNGILRIVPSLAPTNGSVTLDGTAGSPTLSVAPATAGQFATMNGDLTYAAGTVTGDFDFGSLPPSGAVAPIQASGNVVCTVTPQVTIEGSAIPVGTYPLIKYGGSVSGSLPTTPTSFPAPSGYAGYISNSPSAKTIYLVMTTSPVIASLTWRVGSGNWDINTSLNWIQFGNSVKYTEPNAVQFDDTASGPFPITVTNIATVSPAAITVLGTNAYTISGNGTIAGSGILTKAGTGTLTLSGTNTYTGGTTVSSGQLNINYGGSGGTDSAIGTGSLNLNTGAKMDNTSGHAITLNTATPIPVNWIDDWTFVGSTNLDLGLGQVTLGNVSVILTVVSNTLTVNNLITDNGLNYQLVKQGSGTLTLSNANTFAGGMQLNAGTLNINADGAVGTGQFDINGGTLDNTSGSTVALSATQPSLMNWSGSIIFRGTTNLDLGLALVNVAATTLTLQSNTFFTEGKLDGHNGPGVTVNGSGTWTIGGAISDNTLNVTINGGTVNFNKDSSATAVNGNITAVNTGGTLVMLGVTGTQMGASTTLVLGGGTVEMNGDSESITTVTFNSGTLRNGAPSTTSTIGTSTAFTLVGSNCVFDVTAADSSLAMNNVVSGSGGLVKTGAGLLNVGTNSYTGSTTVSNGTLVLNFPSLASNSTVTVNTNAALGTNGVLTLNFTNSETNTVAALILGGISKPAGVYSTSTDPTFITGTGSIEVTPAAPPINPLPGTILFSASAGTLSLGWPTNGGWILQTNAVSVADTNAWFAYPGSTALTNLNIPILTSKTNVFFRLLKP